MNILGILKDHTSHFACLSLIFNFHTCNVTDNHFPRHTNISFPDILQNLLIFQNQIFKRYTHLKNPCFSC
ncbi:hypothetical protein LDENG_00193830 [Lucifuga dentata]|nr:hypothetical protein LDENG_00193830 [Lucifuga dentata]